MPVFVTGLPLHVLVVHAVVVLVPLAVLGALVVAIWPAARRSCGWLVVATTAVATACIPVATSSGEDLRDRLTPTALIRQHAHLGDELLVFALGLLVAVTALVWFGARSHGDAPGAARFAGRRLAVAGLGALTVAFAVVCAVQVVRIGDSGARAAWTGKHYVAPRGDADEVGADG
jgi:hypothetical protein